MLGGHASRADHGARCARPCLPLPSGRVGGPAAEGCLIDEEGGVSQVLLLGC
jgi:hypothetical protein